MSDNIQAIGGWIFGRVLFAFIIFQILSVPLAWHGEMSTAARLLAIAATPGSIELIAALSWAID